MALRRSELVQLESPLKILLEARATITVHASEHDLRLGVALVHVLLQPAHPLGSRRGGRRSAERAALVMLQAFAEHSLHILLQQQS
eukprot:CAMPEP_0184247876 /NCGR_PEP_ID=MMETSP0977-20130417/2778_1 /TAXON_ID=483370 /ORGANISM="non described non described, Strain CCMP2097" /LENGTH=85 /DNA_ID=CAMNT_0026553207 /DNA_START=81 /DNA_END=339 /DNA_ORIENTATION=-